MSNNPIPLPPSESYLKHKRDLNRKIVLPLILATLIVIGVSILIGYATFADNGDVKRWAEIATIWIVIPIIIFALIVLALLGAMIYGMSRLLNVTPRYTNLAQYYVFWFTAKINQFADSLVEPVLTIKTWISMITPKEK
jgi:heme/copper-type cytochrome/quinol oxidase subunit 2